MNQWFRRHAGINHAAGLSRTNVICDVATGRIVGYVTLSAGQIERAALPTPQQRNKPDPVPATLLFGGMVAASIFTLYFMQGMLGVLPPLTR